MNKFFIKKLPIICFICVPIIFLWHPNWLGFLGTQIPGLILCGVLFGRIKSHSGAFINHFRYGLICSFGSFLCGTLYFLQISLKNLSDSNFLLFIPSFQNILAEVFLTGFFAPFFCSQLFKLFKYSRDKNIMINFVKK